MAKINYVLEGKYKNEKITGGTLLRTDSSPFSKRYISSYTVIDEPTKTNIPSGRVLWE